MVTMFLNIVMLQDEQVDLNVLEKYLKDTQLCNFFWHRYSSTFRRQEPRLIFVSFSLCLSFLNEISGLEVLIQTSRSSCIQCQSRDPQASQTLLVLHETKKRQQ